LEFFLKFKTLGLAIPVAMLLITIGANQGGIIRFSFLPNVASDQIKITLNMPQGTSEAITDSLIFEIEKPPIFQKQSGKKWVQFTSPKTSSTDREVCLVENPYR